MKRPREFNYIVGEYTTAPPSSFEAGTTVDTDGSTKLPSARTLSVPHRRYRRCRQVSPFCRYFLMLVSYCAIALSLSSGVAIIPSLPVANASMTSTAGAISPARMRSDTGTGHNIIGEEERDGWIPLERGLRKKKKSSPSLEEDKDDAKQKSTFSGKKSSAVSSSSNPGECMVPAGKCMHCTFSEQKTYNQCLETGRWQRFKCVLPSDLVTAEAEEESADDLFEMKSCKYTDYEQGIAMFQLQIFCLLIGSLSIMSVKKQNRLYGNVFDRRKQHGANASRSNSNTGSNKRSSAIMTEDDVEIEFTPMNNQQRERVPLVAARVEII